MFATFGKSEVNAGYAFDSVFGKMGIQEGETYFDPIGKVDKRQEMSKEWVQKAPSMSTTTGGTATIYSLLPSFLDPSIVDRTIVQTPLVGMIPRKAVRGRSYLYNVLTALDGAQFLPDNSPLTVQVDTRTNATVTMKYLYAVGLTTGPAIASSAGFYNLQAEDIRAKTISMNQALENEIVNGATATNANGFDGLRTLLSTNDVSNAGAAITLDLIRTDMATVFNANGTCDLIVTDKITHNFIKGLLMDFQRFMGPIEKPSGRYDFGIPDAFIFDGALVIADRYMPTTAAAREILYLDTRYIFLAVLQDYTYEEGGKEMDGNKFWIKWYGALVVTFESCMVQRTALA